MTELATKLVVLSVIALPFLGCGHRVRTTTQDLQLIILSRERGVPVPDVHVKIKFLTDWTDIQRPNWEKLPWHEGTTDLSGAVVVVVKLTMMDETRGMHPPDKRDLRNWMALVRLDDTSVPEAEEARLTMLHVGEETASESFHVRVKSIGELEYVD